MTDKIISQLQNLKNGQLKPDRIWVARNREKLLATISRVHRIDDEQLTFWQQVSGTMTRITYIFVGSAVS